MAAVSVAELFLEALEVIGELLHSEDEEIRYRAAALILELSTGLVPIP